MSNSVTVTTEGFEQLRAKIQLLANDKDKRREVLMILRQVARPTLAAAKSLVPISKKMHVARGQKVNPGNLKKSLGLITGKNKENPTILVGARVKGSQKGWYAAFVHDGVNVYRKGFTRKRTKGANMSAAVRRTPSNPFLTNAFKQTEAGATVEAEKKMAAFLQRRINKLST